MVIEAPFDYHELKKEQIRKQKESNKEIKEEQPITREDLEKLMKMMKIEKK